MAISVVSFSFSSCSTGGPGAQLSAGWWLSLLHLITNWSGPQTPSGVLQAPSAECGFPYHIFTLSRLISNFWLPVFTELYNSSIAHSIAHSIFGMACLIVIKRKQLSCSSEVTLVRCISLWVYHGLLPCTISSAKSPNAISFDYWQLRCVTSFRCITLEWHVWPGRRSKYNNSIYHRPYIYGIFYYLSF